MIPIAKTRLGKEEIKAVIEVLKSGNLRDGAVCRSFEDAFAKKVQARYATTISSGTAALHAAYLYFIRPGDEVIVPAFTFFATASMVCWAQGKPVFCDIDPETFCMDVNDLKQKITRRTKAIAPVHLFGNSCDIDAILKVARKHNLRIIWDSAQAHLTKYKGKDVGSCSDAVCYSFYATKNMTTAEGGMITSPHKEFIESCIMLKNQGQKRKYYHATLGGNYRMTDIQAAIGLVQLGRLDEFTQLRVRNARLLTEGLRDIKGISFPYIPDYASHSFHLYTILLKKTPKQLTRDKFIAALKEKGIQAAIHYPIPLHKQPVFKKIAGNISLPNAEDISRRCVSLPVHPLVTEKDIYFMVSQIKDILL